jgi:transmembrane sensor
VVKAAARRIVADHCTFDVRCEDGEVQVVMIQGQANVLAGGAPDNARPAVLQRGDRLVSDRGSDHRDKPNLTRMLAWQSGSAVFENDTLSDAVREMNLYSSEKLEIADRRVMGMRVSGVYRVGDNVGFARSVSLLLPVTIDRQNDRIVLSASDLQAR